MEYLISKEAPSFPEQLEILPSLQKDLKRLENMLVSLVDPEAAEQCVFVLRSMADEDFRNHCDRAVKDFGQRLAHRFGDEESFFELAPHAKFKVARSSSPSLPKVGYQKSKHHDIALLEFTSPQKKPFSLGFDLTYGTVAAGEKDPDKMLILYTPGIGEKALKRLQDQYGGKWSEELEFDPRTGNFVASLSTS